MECTDADNWNAEAEAIGQFLKVQQGLAVTYAEGMTRGAAPAGFNVDHLRHKLGNGGPTFEAAVAALRSWEMFRQDGIRLESGGRSPELGATVAIIVRVGPMWWSNACRVVYVIDEAEPVRRVGFANGTLPGHAECGEEVFLVEMDAGRRRLVRPAGILPPTASLSAAGLSIHASDAAALLRPARRRPWR